MRKKYQYSKIKVRNVAKFYANNAMPKEWKYVKVEGKHAIFRKEIK